MTIGNLMLNANVMIHFCVCQLALFFSSNIGHCFSIKRWYTWMVEALSAFAAAPAVASLPPWLKQLWRDRLALQHAAASPPAPTSWHGGESQARVL